MQGYWVFFCVMNLVFYLKENQLMPGFLSDSWDWCPYGTAEGEYQEYEGIITLHVNGAALEESQKGEV